MKMGTPLFFAVYSDGRIQDFTQDEPPLDGHCWFRVTRFEAWPRETGPTDEEALLERIALALEKIVETMPRSTLL